MASRETAADDYIRELTTYLHCGDRALHAHGRPGDRRRQRHRRRRRRRPGRHGGPRRCARAAPSSISPTPTPDSPRTRGTSFLLPRIVGARRTMELLLLNRTLPAGEALGWGLVNEVVAEEQLLRARARARRAARRRAPRGAYGATKRLVAASLGAFESQMILESETIAAPRGGRGGHRGHHAPSCRSASRSSPARARAEAARDEP